MFALQETWHPEKIKPPDWVGQKFSGDEGPRLAERNQAGPADFSCGRGRVAADVLQFPLGDSWMFAGLTINQEPKCEPNEAECTDGDEGRSPAPVDHNPGDEECREDRAGVCSSVENAGGQCAFFLGKPLCYRFDTGGKYSGFAEAKRVAGDRETAERVCERGAHRGEAPENHGQRVA
jgi:hypothetical protein